MDIKQIYEVIYKAIDEVNQQETDNNNAIIKEPKSSLYEGGNGLDSVGLVNLLFSIEDILASEYNINISLSDEKAVSREKSPFKTIETLATYINELK